MLGDDDAINPELLAAVAWAKAQALDCLISSRPAQYWWPDIHFRLLGDSAAGTLDLTAFTGKVSHPDPQEQLWRCAREAARGLCDLPRTYYGVVKRECLEQLREKTGAYCRVSPDMSIAVGLADCVQRMAKIDYPLFLPGSSAKSTAGMGARGKHVGRLEDQPHLPEECIRNWSDLVPRYFSGPTIWAEACVQTLRAAGRDDVLREFNLPLLYASCLVFDRSWWRVAIKSFGRARRAVGKGIAWGSLKLASYYVSTWYLRAQSLWRNLTKSSSVSTTRAIRGICDVETAVLRLTEHLQSNGVSLGLFLDFPPNEGSSPECGETALDGDDPKDYRCAALESNQTVR